MNENLDLVKILKDIPKGTKLWSPICGECTFQYIDNIAIDFPIVCLAVDKYGQKTQVLFTKYGWMYSIFAYGECVLFPSKENRDWSTFKAPKRFEPFQKVLRASYVGTNKCVWTADLYSYYNKELNRHYFVSGHIDKNDKAIPYEGNEDKLGKIVE